MDFFFWSTPAKVWSNLNVITECFYLQTQIVYLKAFLHCPLASCSLWCIISLLTFFRVPQVLWIEILTVHQSVSRRIIMYFYVLNCRNETFCGASIRRN